MSKKRMGPALILVFVSGIVVGGIGSRILSRRVRRNPEKLQRVVMRRMSHRLDLREDQYPQVAAVIDETLDSLGKLHDRNQAEFVRILEEAGERLKPILDERQSAKLANMLADLHARLDAKRMALGE